MAKRQKKNWSRLESKLRSMSVLSSVQQVLVRMVAAGSRSELRAAHCQFHAEPFSFDPEVATYPGPSRPSL